MARTGDDITAALRLWAGGLWQDEIWTSCYLFVRNEIRRRNLPARDYAPIARISGGDWTPDDYRDLTADWIIAMKGDGARRLVPTGCTDKQVLGNARNSLYQFVIDGREWNARKDLAAAFRDAFVDFSELTEPGAGPMQSAEIPNEPFPSALSTGRQRQRIVSTPQVRAALDILARKQARGWTVRGLLRVLAQWARIEGGDRISLDGLSFVDPVTESPDRITAGRELAEKMRANLTPQERSILCRFIIPNELNQTTLENAALELNIKRSTLHDQSQRLRAKLSDWVRELDDVSAAAFFESICPESGKQDIQVRTIEVDEAK